jgi:hypothetical protein
MTVEKMSWREGYATNAIKDTIPAIRVALGSCIQDILTNVEEIEDQVVWYLIRMKSTGSHTY